MGRQGILRVIGMNIKDARQEIKYAIGAYLEKDDRDCYIMEERFCRPILLMGAPGIGKTALMKQIADEMGINLVSYTITHHTRQSAIGLPVVEKRNYGGREYSVTDYTMSEIIASVYDRIEESGISEGILFLDEINCVSETLLPTMLQFLQYKTFGTHKVPRGFVIICAGNPPKYNRSAREFDMVTLDRLRRIDIDVDAEVFLQYASEFGIHGAIQAFLDIRKDYFYRIRTDVEETDFVTARGWEDLSRMLLAYERNDYPVTIGMIREYLSDPEIAEAFYVYYELYKKYRLDFAVTDIAEGLRKEGPDEISGAPFDEKLSLIHLLLDYLVNRFYKYSQDKKSQLKLREMLLSEKESMDTKVFEDKKAGFEKSEDERQDDIDQTDNCLTNILLYLDRTFKEGQEMVLFLTAMGRSPYAREFLADCGNEAYDKYSKLLLLRHEREELKRELATI